jgi:hypothetical protein
MAVIDNGLPEMPTPDADQLASWDEWVAGRPPAVREMCESFPPWHYYDMPKTGQIVTVRAYAEDGTMRVLVVGDQISIPAIVPLEVFGVPAEDLVRRR